ncbi:MAG: hypothetical protein AABX29_04480 [Nanoarchaeota archaeon]
MKLTKETILKIIGLDLLIVFLFYYVSKFFIDKARGVLYAIQDLNYQFGDINSVLETNKSNFNPMALQNSVGLLNSYFSKLFLYVIALAIILFLIYVVVKSLMWNLICNNKLKSYKKYLFKFLGLALLASLLILPLSYFILINSREFLLEFMFGEQFLWSPFMYSVFYLLLLAFILYLLATGYVYINNLSFINSLKEIFSFNKFWLFLVFLLMFLVSFLIIRIGNLMNQSIYSSFLQFFLILLVFIWYRIYLAGKLL